MISLKDFVKYSFLEIEDLFEDIIRTFFEYRNFEQKVLADRVKSLMAEYFNRVGGISVTYEKETIELGNVTCSEDSLYLSVPRTLWGDFVNEEKLRKELEKHFDEPIADYLTKQLSDYESELYNELKIENLLQAGKFDFESYARNDYGYSPINYEDNYIIDPEEIINFDSLFDNSYFTCSGEYSLDIEFKKKLSVASLLEMTASGTLPDEILKEFARLMEIQMKEQAKDFIKKVDNDVDYYFDTVGDDIAEKIYDEIIEHIGITSEDTVDEVDEKILKFSEDLKRKEYEKKYQRKLFENFYK